LVDQGVLTEDDHVELLEGVIVAMPPEGPQHAEVGELVADALRAAIGDRARVRTDVRSTHHAVRRSRILTFAPLFPRTPSNRSSPVTSVARSCSARARYTQS